jgi:hypothetical protein
LKSLRFRQIHLDYHTSEAISPIAEDFDPDRFADTLAHAQVDSVTCFARCHHGWIYYRTGLSPERQHPGLSIDLLGQQISACHRQSIRVPIYTSVQWDNYAAKNHPEWLCRTVSGMPTGNAPLDPGFYNDLCLNTPYRDWLMRHVSEILESVPTDGFFFDIVRPVDCVCAACIRMMQELGLEPKDPTARAYFSRKTVDEFKLAMRIHVRASAPECSIFYNAGHIGPRDRPTIDAYTHFEVESLPGGQWGYAHFPVTIRYARTLGLDCLGHTGRFHTSWGDFHSFKNPAALRYECLRMLTQGAKCLIGDQLSPAGRLDPHVYELIGAVYSEVKSKEDWCIDSKPVIEIGVLTPEEFEHLEAGTLPGPIKGAVSILEQGSHQFNVVDWASDFSGYNVIILPDHIQMTPTTARKLEGFAAQGGKVLASFASGMDAGRNDFLSSIFGVSADDPDLRRQNQSDECGRAYEHHNYCEYLVPKAQLTGRLPPVEHAMYRKGMKVRTIGEVEVLGVMVRSYFDRTYRHFCSHRQTPSSGVESHPGIIKNGSCIYFTSPVFTQYNDNAPRWCKVLVLDALRMLLESPLISHNGPSTLSVTVTEQRNHDRWIVHLLHFIPERRSEKLDVLEDVIPLNDLQIRLRTKRKIASVMLVPERTPIPFDPDGEELRFTLQRLDGHAMVAVDFDQTGAAGVYTGIENPFPKNQ